MIWVSHLIQCESSSNEQISTKQCKLQCSTNGNWWAFHIAVSRPGPRARLRRVLNCSWVANFAEVITPYGEGDFCQNYRIMQYIAGIAAFAICISSTKTHTIFTPESTDSNSADTDAQWLLFLLRSSCPHALSSWMIFLSNINKIQHFGTASNHCLKWLP